MTAYTDHPPPPPAELKQRVTASLRRNGVLRPRPSWSQVPLAVAAGLVLFLAGTQWPRSAPANAGREPAFVLLLYEDTTFTPAVPAAEVVREYTAWAAEVAERGDLVLAEELDPLVQVVVPGARVDTGSLGQPTGLFVLRAADSDAARELARNHPHLKHGGRIVVRGFVRQK